MNLTTFWKTILLYSVLFGTIVSSKKLSLPDLGNLNLGKLNECTRCKVLTDSFSHWLDKTSRGKYEGGDAAWEESKLKSYARSEIRLVEIQEGLCSELKRYQDDCYALAEETEQVIERWWFSEDTKSIDLHTWLCTETLKYCCPENHYGLDCSPCPRNKNNLVCGGRGKCDGDGTREGNGTCLCRRGYAGIHCQECAGNFYLGSDDNCEPCHASCNGCTGSAPTSCKTCNTGWQLQTGSCVDIDECKDTNTCKFYQYCVNNEGSYTCKNCDISCKTCVGQGDSNCASCDSSSVLWSGMCIDEKQKKSIIVETLKRQTFYFGLVGSVFLTFYISKSFSTTVILIIGVYIYYLESSSRFSLPRVLFNYYNTYR